MPDRRARHYWDAARAVGAAYRSLKDGTQTLDLGMEAWDVWLLFGRDAAWAGAAPPEPLWWEHQLRGLSAERRLDPARFAAKAAEIGKHP